MGGHKFTACIVWFLLTSSLLAQVSIEGVVRHSRTGLPISGAALYLGSADGIRKTTTTDPQGRFRFSEVASAEYEIAVSAVGFGLARRALSVGDADLEIEVLLSPGTRIHDELTINANPEASAVSLPEEDLHQLKTVLLDDPIRALSHHPRLTAGDDFNTGFAFQGSGYDRLGVILDGIPVYAMSHTIGGLHDTGSTSVLSADLLSNLELASAAGASSHGAFSAGSLRMSSRTGIRDRWRSLASVSGTALLGVSEGPVGRGSWILSARQSYVDWLVRKIDPDADAGFGFRDVFGKVTQELGDSHQLSGSFLAGRTGVQDLEEGNNLTRIDQGRFISAVAHGDWIWQATPDLIGRTHLYAQGAWGRNRNPIREVLWTLDETVVGVRTEWSFSPHGKLLFTGGLGMERWSAAARSAGGFLAEEGAIPLPTQYDETPRREEYFFDARWQPAEPVALSASIGRHRQTHGGGFNSGRAALQWRTRRLQAALGWGQSGQFPFFGQLYGPFAAAGLGPERSRVVNGGLRVVLSESWWLESGAYRRTRDRVPWRVGGQWRLLEGQVTQPAPVPYSNILEDRSKGVDLRLGFAQGGLQGWLGYGWSESRWSETPESWFPGNYDQGHVGSWLLHYRTGSAFEFALKGRFAGGLPLPLYARQVAGRYFVSPERNQVRLPAYGRFDLRGAKTFDRDRLRLSLFVEILNLLGRENQRYSGLQFGDVNPSTGRLHGVTSKQFPFLPTAGLVVEF